uniref:ATP synthase gamma chain, chloroplastic n=1 Tax=Pinguiococcus pyrenoidosus TaxID=172671 RepID=A0A7R9UGL8_9STRA|mmetsp:Transcript_9060/g.34183  ORF Transcript_9060/g.34183 Transcript_9060/m.34183 type:complete len:360 (+) Transcript_9060:83-1162(+)
MAKLLFVVLAALVLALASAFVAPKAGVTSVRSVSNGRRGPTIVMDGKSNAIRDRIKSVKNTKKITEAMRLVAAAKVRRAQDACLQTRPFTESVQSVFSGIVDRLGNENLDIPLLTPRAEIKKVLVVLITGDRGLCGGYNNNAIKKAESRLRELEAQGIEYALLLIGNKGSTYFKNRNYPIYGTSETGQAPTGEQATAITEEMLADFLSGEVDRVELIYTRFVSLIASEPSLRTLLPLTATGIESEGDEIFSLTTKEGEFSVSRTEVPAAEPEEFPADMIFEQDPVQILNALVPLYLNGQVLRTLQESVASELAARMAAMQAASDNAKELGSKLTLQYNRARQASVTQEILEIVAGANAL